MTAAKDTVTDGICAAMTLIDAMAVLADTVSEGNAALEGLSHPALKHIIEAARYNAGIVGSLCSIITKELSQSLEAMGELQ